MLKRQLSKGVRWADCSGLLNVEFGFIGFVQLFGGSFSLDSAGPQMVGGEQTKFDDGKDRKEKTNVKKSQGKETSSTYCGSLYDALSNAVYNRKTL